jgi:predicted dehydrogenase
MEHSRRDFFKTSTLLSTAASARAVLGANDRIRIGVIGTGGRGQYLMRTLNRIAPGEIEFIAVCDIYDVRRAQAAKIAGGNVEQYVDYKQVLDRKDIDAVIVATPDHWHSAIATDALNAGKDVYVEKPMVHTPKDGLSIVKAARANNRIVQVGMQGRLMPHFVEAKQKYIDTGIIGKVGLARTWYLSNNGYVQTAPAGFEKKPEGLDWNRWLGPGPKVAWDPGIYFSPYKWLYYDGGMIMGIGIHVLDSAHHWLSLKKPSAAVAMGGTYFYKDGRDTPDTLTFMLEYPEDVLLTFTAECLTAPGVKTSAGVELRGSGGSLWGERYVQDIGYTYTPNRKYSKEPAASVPAKSANAETILRDWLERMRDRKKTVANEEEGYYSSIACFMANQAFRTKSRVVWDKTWDLPA